MTRESTEKTEPRVGAAPTRAPASPFPRFEQVADRLASGAEELDQREAETPRTESAAELRLRMTRRTLGR